MEAICRLCLIENENSTPLYGLIEMDSQAVTLSMQVVMCTSVWITRTDRLPKLICSKCHDFVRQWFTFRQKCLKNDEILRKSLLTSGLDLVDCIAVDTDQKLSNEADGNESCKSDEDSSRIVPGDNGKECKMTVKKLNEELPCLEDFTSNADLLKNVKGKDKKLKTVRKSEPKQILYPQCCGQNFITKVSFRIHMNKDHPGEKQCDKCGKRGFSSETTLRRHKILHSKIYSCNQCQKSFTCRALLRIHERDKHEDDHPFVCEVCAKAFVTSRLLIYHQRFHTGEKNYQCEVCGGAFTTNSGLCKHMRTHGIVKPHVCEFCSKGFNIRSRLIEHIRVHTGDRPFSCSDCDKSFTMLDKLKRHKKTHNVSAVGQ